MFGDHLFVVEFACVAASVRMDQPMPNTNKAPETSSARIFPLERLVSNFTVTRLKLHHLDFKLCHEKEYSDDIALMRHLARNKAGPVSKTD